MAKKKAARRKKAHRVGKKRRTRKGGGQALRAATGTKRAKLHAAAALLKDFHGGKNPIKSGCGRPRKKRRS